jgi:hypothetical protein
MSHPLLHFHHEDSLATTGVNPYIVGVDEVGYGAWAGSIVVAAVWINRQMISDNFLNALNDSKKLSSKKRLYLCQAFVENEVWGSYAMACVPVKDIVQGLVLKHTLQAMTQAVQCLDGYVSNKGIELWILGSERGGRIHPIFKYHSGGGCGWSACIARKMGTKSMPWWRWSKLQRRLGIHFGKSGKRWPYE